MLYTNKYQAAPIPRSAIEAEARKQAIQAFKTYDPRKGKFSSHVGNYMQKLFRFVASHQNVGRIPEHRVQKISTYKNVFNAIRSERDREPTLLELSDELMWKPNEVMRIQKELRKDLSRSESFQFDQTHDFDRTAETLNFAYYSFSREEQLVYDYLTGSNGKPRLTIGQTAKKMRRDNADIAKMRDKVVGIIKNHSGGLI